MKSAELPREMSRGRQLMMFSRTRQGLLPKPIQPQAEAPPAVQPQPEASPHVQPQPEATTMSRDVNDTPSTPQEATNALYKTPTGRAEHVPRSRVRFTYSGRRRRLQSVDADDSCVKKKAPATAACRLTRTRCSVIQFRNLTIPLNNHQQVRLAIEIRHTYYVVRC